ncbi:MAG: hypothetical protein K5657_08045 [Desulfovibrio sp.]|nr:hypothetical protein [Desulfovibrio sp.]
MGRRLCERYCFTYHATVSNFMTEAAETTHRTKQEYATPRERKEDSFT